MLFIHLKPASTIIKTNVLSVCSSGHIYRILRFAARKKGLCLPVVFFTKPLTYKNTP